MSSLGTRPAAFRHPVVRGRLRRTVRPNHRLIRIMSKRSSPPVDRGPDPERTDELPALDIKAVEGRRADVVDEPVRTEPASLGGDLRTITENIRSLEANLKTRAGE